MKRALTLLTALLLTPLAPLHAEQELTRTRLDYLTVVTGHNRAQFLLRGATGAEAPPRGRK